MFSRLNGICRVATCYSRLAGNYASAVALAAITFWCRPRPILTSNLDHQVEPISGKMWRSCYKPTFDRCDRLRRRRASALD